MKQSIAVIYGGQNAEHEVSIVSARSVLKYIDRNKFRVIEIKIEKDGKWIAVASNSEISPWDLKEYGLHCIFPVLHGPLCEDGSLQGLLDYLNVPYVGCDTTASAVCKHKHIQKQLCAANGIAVVPWQAFGIDRWNNEPETIIKEVEKSLPYPTFIKPCRQGSSIGVSKARNRTQLTTGIQEAFVFDTICIIEKAVPQMIELEIAALGNGDDARVSKIARIHSSNEFYDYDAKYVDGKSTTTIPAPLSAKESKELQSIALRAYALLGCSGLSRIDFMMDGITRKIYLNEVNTMPGFTTISMYPELWGKSGISYPQLISRLISLGVERFNSVQNIKTSYQPKLDWYSS